MKRFPMRRVVRALLALGLGAVSCAVAADEAKTRPAPAAVLGYSVATTAPERALEQRFRDGVSADNIRAYMRRLSAHPHHVGSTYGKDNAEWILARFREWGYEAHIERFDVLFPTPRARVLELVTPGRFRASLQEPRLAIDPTSGQAAEQLPTYNAYSADGDVTAPLVYVNYGNREDYEELDRLKISVKGAIVIARYGRGWRGIKPKVAAEHGAVGCIIYSDPADDGYAQGDVYPEGGWRASQGVQRGSVMDTDHPGDPLTPGVGATAEAKRLPLAEAATLTKIPVLPISYADALPFLSALKGPLVPKGWRGALAITYHVGPGPAVAHLKVASNWDLKPVYDVIATLKGSADAEQWVIRGNHHDAWVNGAEDPISGQAAMLEEARVLGSLHQQGWTPRRTIIYAAWDGEEPGLLGSVEWVETHVEDLKAHAVAYINSDDSGRGYLDAAGTHDLGTVVNSIARDVTDPETKLNLIERLRLSLIADAKGPDERAEVRKNEDVALELLGDGSDFTAFQDYAGISTVHFGFGGEPGGTQYHSIYDDFYWYTHFADTDFAYERALSQTAGTATLRLAGADYLPIDYVPQADVIDKIVRDLEKLLKDRQDEYAERELQLKEGVYAATVDPRRPLIAPVHEPVPPYLNFAPMKNAASAFRRSADRYAAALARLRAAGSPALPEPARLTLNADLLRVSRLFLNPKGLPGRPWFKHQLYAPGAYSGYDAQPAAAVREYMEQKKWREAESQVPMVADAIQAAAAGVDQVARDLEAAVESATR